MAAFSAGGPHVTGAPEGLSRPANSFWLLFLVWVRVLSVRNWDKMDYFDGNPGLLEKHTHGAGLGREVGNQP